MAKGSDADTTSKGGRRGKGNEDAAAKGSRCRSSDRMVTGIAAFDKFSDELDKHWLAFYSIPRGRGALHTFLTVLAFTTWWQAACIGLLVASLSPDAVASFQPTFDDAHRRLSRIPIALQMLFVTGILSLLTVAVYTESDALSQLLMPLIQLVGCAVSAKGAADLALLNIKRAEHDVYKERNRKKIG